MVEPLRAAYELPPAGKSSTDIPKLPSHWEHLGRAPEIMRIRSEARDRQHRGAKPFLSQTELASQALFASLADPWTTGTAFPPPPAFAALYVPHYEENA
jgi:hypothetical protein